MTASDKPGALPLLGETQPSAALAQQEPLATAILQSIWTSRPGAITKNEYHDFLLLLPLPPVPSHQAQCLIFKSVLLGS